MAAAKKTSGSSPSKASPEISELKQTLTILNTSVDRLGSAFTQASQGNVGSAAASGASGLASAAGSLGLAGGPELAAIAAALQLVAPLIDKIVTLLPDLNASLQTFNDIAKAGQRVSNLAEEAALHGQPLSREYIRERIQAESEAEHARTRARAEVQSVVTETQFRAFPW